MTFTKFLQTVVTNRYVEIPEEKSSYDTEPLGFSAKAELLVLHIGFS